MENFKIIKFKLKLKKYWASIYFFKTRKEMILALQDFLQSKEVDCNQAAQVCCFDKYSKSGKKSREIMKGFFCVKGINDIILIHEALHMAINYLFNQESTSSIILRQHEAELEEKIGYAQGYIYRNLKEQLEKARVSYGKRN
jgi:hypothetical protein